MAAKKKAVTTRAVAKKKTAAKKAAVKKAAVKKAAPKKTTPKKKVTAKKAVARKAVVKKAAPKKTAVKKAAPKKAAPKKAAVKKAAVKKTTANRSPARKRPASQIGPVPGIAPYKEDRGEEYMNDKQVQHFRNILLAWKRELMEEVDRTVHHMQDDAANFPDPNDRATQESEFSMELRARDRERKLIKKIDESIRHLDNDEFGYCEACGVEIGVKRLEARPTATLCIDCKILDEIREKQMG
jgi:DnaK suppressor protein